MKKITCAELGGGCDLSFFTESFEEAAKQSQEHAMQMFKLRDKAHLDAAEKMKTLMSSPREIDNWMEDRQAYFLLFTNFIINFFYTQHTTNSVTFIQGIQR